MYERNSWGTAELTLLGREPDVPVNNLASIQSQGSNRLVSPKPDVPCRCKAISHTGHIRSRELEDMCSLIKGRKKKKEKKRRGQGEGEGDNVSVLRSSKVADTLLHMCVVCQPGFCYPDVGVDPMAGTTKEKAFKRNHISVVKLMLPDFSNAISSVIFQNALVK